MTKSPLLKFLLLSIILISSLTITISCSHACWLSLQVGPPQYIPADGKKAAIITAKLRRQDGGPNGGQTVNFSITSGPGTLDPISKDTKADGTAKIKYIQPSDPTPAKVIIMASVTVTGVDGIVRTFTATGEVYLVTLELVDPVKYILMGRQTTFTAQVTPELQGQYSWSIGSGADKAQIVSASGNTAAVVGINPSKTIDDVTLSLVFQPGGTSDQIGPVNHNFSVIKLFLKDQNITRGGTVTLKPQIEPQGFSFDNYSWRFEASNGTKITGPNGIDKTSWAGKVCIGGTVTLQATIGGVMFEPEANIQVVSRKWNADVQPPTVDRSWQQRITRAGELGNAEPTGLKSGDINVITTSISDNGPNNGFCYVAAPPTKHGMIIRINSYLVNPNSDFSRAQGNANDIQAIGLTNGQPYATAITAGNDGKLDTKQSPDDTIEGDTITTGPDGVCNTRASIYDITIIKKGFGRPNSVIIKAGPDGRLNIAANKKSDDKTEGTYITSGKNGIANTQIDNRAEVSQATLLNIVERHEGVPADPADDSHWSRWYHIEASDTDMNEEAEDEIGVGTAGELKKSVTAKLDVIRIRLIKAYDSSGEPSSYGVVDLKYPDPSWPAY